MVRACSREARVAIAVARAIVCSSMEIRRPFDRNDRSGGNVLVRHRTPDISAERSNQRVTLSPCSRSNAPRFGKYLRRKDYERVVARIGVLFISTASVPSDSL
jgi:hypothetical protein